MNRAFAFAPGTTVRVADIPPCVKSLPYAYQYFYEPGTIVSVVGTTHSEPIYKVKMRNDTLPDIEVEGKYLTNCYSDGWPVDAYESTFIRHHVASKYEVKKIIYNDPATIVFWKDGTKTVVKCAKGEKFNEYTAFCAALAKKVYGTNSRVTKIVKSGEEHKWK